MNTETKLALAAMAGVAGLAVLAISHKANASPSPVPMSDVPDAKIAINGLSPSWYKFDFEAPSDWPGAPTMFQRAGFQAVSVNEFPAGVFAVRAGWKQFGSSTTLVGPIRNLSFAPTFGPTL